MNKLTWRFVMGWVVGLILGGFLTIALAGGTAVEGLAVGALLGILNVQIIGTEED